MNKILFLGGILFLLIRLLTITSIPIFNDEAIYMKWGYDFWYKPADINVPVSVDGKQVAVPFVYGFLQTLPRDPLFASRIFNVVFSLVTYISIMLLAKKYLTRFQLVMLTGFLISSPFLLLFDRMALPDSIVVALYSLGVLLSFKIYGKPSILASISLGLILAFGWWWKSTILLFFIPLTLMHLYLLVVRKGKRWDYITSFVLIVGIFYLLILPLLENPTYKAMVHQENARLLKAADILALPVGLWANNFLSVLSILLFYLSPLVAVIFLILSLSNWLDRTTLARGPLAKPSVKPLFIWAFLPIIFEVLFLKNIDARYMVLAVPLLLLFLCLTIKANTYTAKVLSAVLIVFILLNGLVFTLFPLQYYSFYKQVPFVSGDFSQYVMGWTSGYGVKEAIDYIQAESKERPIIVFVRPDSGNPEEAVYAYLHRDERVDVYPVNALPVLTDRKKHTLVGDPSFYFVSRGNQFAGLEKRLVEIAKYKKPLDDEFVGVYKIE